MNDSKKNKARTNNSEIKALHSNNGTFRSVFARSFIFSFCSLSLSFFVSFFLFVEGVLIFPRRRLPPGFVPEDLRGTLPKNAQNVERKVTKKKKEKKKRRESNGLATT